MLLLDIFSFAIECDIVDNFVFARYWYYFHSDMTCHHWKLVTSQGSSDRDRRSIISLNHSKGCHRFVVLGSLEESHVVWSVWLGQGSALQLVVEHKGLEGDRQRVDLQILLPHHPGGQTREARVYCGVGDLKREESYRAYSGPVKFIISGVDI